MRVFIIVFLSHLASVQANSNCTNAYSSAGYSLSHTKKALNADNFDHQQYYAGRALEAFEKTKDLVADCGCDSSLVPILKGIENLEKAIDPNDWELGRYYTKRALKNAYSLQESLDICTEKAATDKDTGEELQKIYIKDNSSQEGVVSNTIDAEKVAYNQHARNKYNSLREKIIDLASLCGCKSASLEKIHEDPLTTDIPLESLTSIKRYYLNKSLELNELFERCVNECLSDLAGE